MHIHNDREFEKQFLSLDDVGSILGKLSEQLPGMSGKNVCRAETTEKNVMPRMYQGSKNVESRLRGWIT